MQRLREYLTLALIGLLPFHAFLVTVATRAILGPGHAPLPLLAAWKEGVIVIILLMSIVEVLIRCVECGKWNVECRKLFRIDGLDACILGLVTIAMLSIFFNIQHSTFNIHSILLGFKYTLFPLVAFLILRRVPWGTEFMERATHLLLIIGGIVAAYGIVTFFLPLSFFTVLGYSGGHSLYQPEGPLAAFQQIGGSAIRRIQSTMSGPNQLGLWLLIPWSITIMRLLQRVMVSLSNHGTRVALRQAQGDTLIFLTLGAAMFLTFSRAAWIGAAVVVTGAVVMQLPRRLFLRAIGALCVSGCVVLLLLLIFLPSVLQRTQSNRGHWERPIAALRLIRDHPLGLGLGSAGPAQNRTREPCVFLPDGADASWAKNNPSLCVFVGDEQIQPAGRACDCPLLPENWYLQIGVELGVIGLLLFVLLTVIILRRLKIVSSFRFPASSVALASFLIFLALSIAALFLHAWEDSAVAYTTWILAVVALL